jgi:uncharacterized protein YajQ (UPF0234 family)
VRRLSAVKPAEIRNAVESAGEHLERRMNSNLNILSEKIQTLSAEQITEVEDFVEFLRFRAQERELVRSAAAVSTAAFESTWNNPEDDVYDAL